MVSTTRFSRYNRFRSTMTVPSCSRNVLASSAVAETAGKSAANITDDGDGVTWRSITLNEPPVPAPQDIDNTPIPEHIQSIPAPPEAVLRAYEVPDGTTVEQAGRLLEARLGDALAPTGAVLVRNLPVSSIAEVAQMVAAAQQADALRPQKSWTSMPYVPFGAPREERDGIMMATNIPPEYVLSCHNESAYNPLVPRRIGLLCLEPAAEGGESLIVTNESLTECGPPELFEFVRKHGGLKYQRTFPDKFSDEPKTPFSMAWQDRCGVGDDGTREQAEEYWKANGFADEHIEWGPKNTLIITNIATGCTPAVGADVDAPFPGGYSAFSTSAEVAESLDLRDSNSDSSVPERQDWFNILCSMPRFFSPADGTAVPPELAQMHAAEAWNANFAVKMQAGDLLMLDNLRVQHGRMPYTNKGDGKRTVVTLLYE